MAWTRFGFTGPGDELPIDQWMDDQNEYMARRDFFDAAGQDAWNTSTRTGRICRRTGRAMSRRSAPVPWTRTEWPNGPNPAFHQYFSAGRNQGRLGADASLALSGGLAELGLDGVIPFETNVLKFRGQGFNQSQAEHLAQPYTRWGHHVAARRWGLPDFITENPLFQLKPRGISRGDFYQLHFENDPKFFGARFPKDVGGSWRGKTDLRLQKNGPMGQFWNGTPSSLKSVVGSGVAANDAAWNH